MTFKVTNVIDGDTFEVSPYWRWNNQSGNRVRPTGYDTPEIGQFGYEAAKEQLKRLILEQNIELRSAYRLDRGRIVCDVYFNGRNLADYFSKYK